MFFSINCGYGIEKTLLADSRKDKVTAILLPSTSLTQSEIDSLRADLHEAIQVLQKRWGKVRTTKSLHPKI